MCVCFYLNNLLRESVLKTLSSDLKYVFNKLTGESIDYTNMIELELIIKKYKLLIKCLMQILYME